MSILKGNFYEIRQIAQNPSEKRSFNKLAGQFKKPFKDDKLLAFDFNMGFNFMCGYEKYFKIFKVNQLNLVIDLTPKTYGHVKVQAVLNINMNDKEYYFVCK